MVSFQVLCDKIEERNEEIERLQELMSRLVKLECCCLLIDLSQSILWQLKLDLSFRWLRLQFELRTC